MKKLMTYVLLAASVALLLFSCSNKNSDEACRHEVTMNLDRGNYDAVIASGCANAMQKGAAYFGKAGFDAKDVVNRFIDANSTSNSQSDFNIYMTSLVGQVGDTTLSDLDSAHAEYTAILPTAVDYRDAQFYVSLVDVMKSLSLMKLVIDVGGTGILNTACDANNNGNADEVDAASCVLLVSAGQACGTGVTVSSDIPNIGIQGKNGMYRGLTITVAGSGPASACPANNQYKKLLYLQNTSWFAATTTAQACQETSPDVTRSWPCPVESGGQPLDLVTAIDTTLNDSINSLSSSLTTATATDVQQSISDIKKQNCCTSPEVWDPNNPASCTCSSSELAVYLQTI